MDFSCWLQLISKYLQLHIIHMSSTYGHIHIWYDTYLYVWWVSDATPSEYNLQLRQKKCYLQHRVIHTVTLSTASLSFHSHSSFATSVHSYYSFITRVLPFHLLVSLLLGVFQFVSLICANRVSLSAHFLIQAKKATSQKSVHAKKHKYYLSHC